MESTKTVSLKNIKANNSIGLIIELLNQSMDNNLNEIFPEIEDNSFDHEFGIEHQYDTILEKGELYWSFNIEFEDTLNFKKFVNQFQVMFNVESDFPELCPVDSYDTGSWDYELKYAISIFSDVSDTWRTGNKVIDICNNKVLYASPIESNIPSMEITNKIQINIEIS